MDLKSQITLAANFALIIALIYYGFQMFAAYHAKGRWAKNITGLLAGAGLLTFAVSLILRPSNTRLLQLIAETGASRGLLWLSNLLLLAAIGAFGIITYLRPLRLWHEKKIERELKRELPKIP